MTASAFDIAKADPALAANKVKCAVCGHEDHSLFGHIKQAHAMYPEDYAKAYPGHQLLSEMGRQIYSTMAPSGAATTTALIVEQEHDSMAVFGVGFGPASDKPKGIRGYAGYRKEDGVPDIDPHYIFQKDITRDVLMGVMASGTKINLIGPTGSGKTTLPEQIAARLGRPFERVQFHGEMESAELTGTWTVGDGGQMIYLYSPLAQALQKPSFIVLDEFDSGNAVVSAIANAVLEGKPLVLSNKGGEKIWPHKDCVIFATGNTNGMGDESGLYASTSVQSFATMNRYAMTIPVDYMKKEDEEALLTRIYPKVPAAEVRDMVKVANLIREAFVGGKLSVVLSTRQLVFWGRWLSMTGDQKRSFHLSFANMLGNVDKHVATELFQRVFATR